MTYYLITDVGTQWFSYVIATEGGEVHESHSLSNLNCHKIPFFSNIYEREIHFGDRKFKSILGGEWSNQGPWYGWSISKTEFERIRRLVELEPSVREFNKLGELS